MLKASRTLLVSDNCIMVRKSALGKCHLEGMLDINAMPSLLEGAFVLKQHAAAVRQLPDGL